MVPSSSLPELSMAMEAPLEMPSLTDSRRRCWQPYPRWVWLALTMILTLAITLTILYYVGALSRNRPPPTNPSMQYKQPPRENRGAGNNVNKTEDHSQADSRTPTPSTQNDDGEDAADDRDVACFLDVESPVNKSPESEPDSPRSASARSGGSGTRSSKRPGSRSAILHFRLDLGLFEFVNFSTLNIDSSFSIVTTKSFSPNFQMLIPKIDVELANGSVLTIYTNRASFPHNPDAMRFYYSLKGDEDPQTVLADVWGLLNNFGPDFREKLVFVKTEGYISPMLLDLFTNELGHLFSFLHVIERANVERDLALASQEPKNRLMIPDVPFFSNVDNLIAQQNKVVQTVNEALTQIIQLWAEACCVPFRGDLVIFRQDVLLNCMRNPAFQLKSSLLSELRHVFEQNVKSPIDRFHNTLDQKDLSVIEFALEVGLRTMTEYPLLSRESDDSAFRIVNDVSSILADERNRLRALYSMKAALQSLHVSL